MTKEDIKRMQVIKM